MIKRIMATAIVAATAGMTIVATASAHPVTSSGVPQVDSNGTITLTRPQPNDVWVGNEFVGRATDWHVRYELLRTYGNL